QQAPLFQSEPLLVKCRRAEQLVFEKQRLAAGAGKAAASELPSAPFIPVGGPGAARPRVAVASPLIRLALERSERRRLRGGEGGQFRAACFVRQCRGGGQLRAQRREQVRLALIVARQRLLLPPRE